jgi:primosomal replication protein N
LAAEEHLIVSLRATVTGREPLRYTPAGIAVIDAVLSHESIQHEAGHDRQVEFDLPVRFAGDQAERVGQLPLGTQIEAQGFLAPRRKGSRSLRLHVTRFSVLAASGL